MTFFELFMSVLHAKNDWVVGYEGVQDKEEANCDFFETGQVENFCTISQKRKSPVQLF